MPAPPAPQHVHGPFDGDFDPFEEEDDGAVMITFGRRPAGTRRLASARPA